MKKDDRRQSLSPRRQGIDDGSPDRPSSIVHRLSSTIHRHAWPPIVKIQTAGSPGGASEGNRVTLYSDGQEVSILALEAIERACERVWLETYILAPDEVGYAAIRALADAARRGCDVRLLFDRWGSPRIGRRHAAPIRDAGGHVAVYNPVLPWNKIGRKIASLLHRDHRKMLLADGVAFCGGRNVSVDYGGPPPDPFYDLTLRLEGPCLRDLASVFIDAFADATGDCLSLPPRPGPLPDGVYVDVLELNRRKRQEDLDRSLEAVLETATARCLLMTPYFIPPDWFYRSLLRAADRGVDVRILTAGRSDVPAVRIAGRHVYGGLLRRGVRLYEMQEPILHAKALTVDGRYGMVGSYNVDRYGSRHNLELGIAVADSALAAALEAEFDAGLAHSVEITLAAWEHRGLAARAAQWLLFQLARI